MAAADEMRQTGADSGEYQQAVVERIMADYESMSRAGKSEAFLEAARPTVEMWAKAVLDVLDLRECCAICGLAEADCTGWDHSEYEHDYGPLIVVGADFGSNQQVPR